MRTHTLHSLYMRTHTAHAHAHTYKHTHMHTHTHTHTHTHKFDVLLIVARRVGRSQAATNPSLQMTGLLVRSAIFALHPPSYSQCWRYQNSGQSTAITNNEQPSQRDSQLGKAGHMRKRDIETSFTSLVRSPARRSLDMSVVLILSGHAR